MSMALGGMLRSPGLGDEAGDFAALFGNTALSNPAGGGSSGGYDDLAELNAAATGTWDNNNYDPWGGYSPQPSIDTPTPDYPGRQSGVDNTNNILGILGATATSIVKAITGNYPPQQQPYGTVPHPVTYNGGNPNNVNNAVSDSVGQSAKQFTKTLTNNIGTVAVIAAVVLLYKSGRK